MWSVPHQCLLIAQKNIGRFIPPWPRGRIFKWAAGFLGSFCWSDYETQIITCSRFHGCPIISAWYFCPQKMTHWVLTCHEHELVQVVALLMLEIECPLDTFPTLYISMTEEIFYSWHVAAFMGDWDWDSDWFLMSFESEVCVFVLLKVYDIFLWPQLYIYIYILINQSSHCTRHFL